ncbi:MAG: phosphoserine aminotransferase apoenzyme [Actinomycetia bacterium]|jgi:phosphoserine aminotransferase|nr:phosphoserine aminotransferase apoenzyme [Actinomycetes bacterium]
MTGAHPTADDLRLPPELLPADGRFGSGPSKVRDQAVASLTEVAHGYLGTSHRREGVRSVVRDVRSGLRDLFSLPDGYEVLLGVGGSTLFWDAASFGLIERRSTHIVIGEFSSKFAQVARAAPHLDEPQVCETAPGETPARPETVEGDVYAYPHNETSTGVTVEVHRPAGDALVVVDGTSAAGGMRFDASASDVYYFAPQKCFASDGGLWLALCSPRAIERIERVTPTRWVPATLDLSIAIENSRLEQTYNTPALATIYLLDQQLKWMLEHGGLDFAAGRSERSAATVYGWAEGHKFATPFVKDPAHRSPVTATIDFDERVDAAALAAALRANGIVDVEPYRKLGRNQLRIALFPAIDPDDVAILTRAIDFLLERMAV